ncbi:MAG TPA: hypothetical protein VIM34_03010 [Burkholderiaceae bacterium]
MFSNQINTDTVTAAQAVPTAMSPPTASPSTPAKPRRSSKRRTEPLRASSSAAYAKDVRLYKARGGTIPCDADALQKYVSAVRNKIAPTTIYRRLMAVRNEHVRLGHPSPTDTPALRPALRQLQLGIVPPKSGVVPALAPKRKEPRQARPITRQLLAKMLDAMGSSTLDRRDRCLLLLGFAAALSRSTLVSLDVADVRFTNDVMVVQMREAGAGGGEQARVVTVPITGHELCAAAATRAWIEHAALDIEGGPLFRRFDRAGDPTKHRLDAAWVSVVVKHRLKEVGVDPEPYSAMSLRRGRLGEAARGTL